MPGELRVIGGTAKGKRLRSIRGIRPITDRVKSALFDILGGEVLGSRFLDLFAGTGSVGIEALSRGASSAVFVERKKRAVRIIEENLAITGLRERAKVLQRDVFDFISRGAEEEFDIIYIAPPQYKGLWAETLRALDSRDLLAKGGLAIAQIFPKEYEELDLKKMSLVDRRRYGSTMLCFYRAKR
jgi:16S rRNA (guanine(966)-N(2))-methyltransferase RsmD